MQGGASLFLTDFWYLAVAGDRLRPGRTLAKRILDEPVLLGRTAGGEVFALKDVCPHRGIPLRYGQFDGHEVTCCYHGWRFAPNGRCTAIPSLAPGQDFDVSRVKVRGYPCRETQGNIWICLAPQANAALGGPPELPDVGDAAPGVMISSVFPCDLDHAAFGLMDPTHAAFVHTSAWWKKNARKLRLKQKAFEPAPLGWRMARHPLPRENRAYRLLGDGVTTEITYSLPGLRIEHVRGTKHSAVALTALTPVDAGSTEVHQCLYWTMSWLRPFKPIVRRLARIFLDQDRAVVVKQQEGLADDPTLMLVDDADTQAKWFQRLKREWLRAQAEGRPFENPVKARTLRWHS